MESCKAKWDTKLRDVLTKQKGHDNDSELCCCDKWTLEAVVILEKGSRKAWIERLNSGLE
jgi:hypothetical protein